MSRQYATLLLETALYEKKWDLAKDLVRFLRAIGKLINYSMKTQNYKNLIVHRSKRCGVAKNIFRNGE